MSADDGAARTRAEFHSAYQDHRQARVRGADGGNNSGIQYRSAICALDDCARQVGGGTIAWRLIARP
jgi:hypothetical protein